MKRWALIATWSLLGLAMALALVVAAWSTSYVARAATSSAAGGTWTVCSMGPPVCDVASVQAAIDAAGAGDTILVAGGTYAGVNDRGGMSQVIYISKTVILRGGYGAPEFFEPPDPIVHLTVLDAQGQGRGVSIVGASEPVLEGFYVTNGTAVRGGGGYLKDTNATLRANTVAGNDAEWGGGLWLEHSPARLEGNTLEGNSALYGGGAVLWSSDASLTGNRVAGNSADAGGGLFLSRSVATLSRNAIVANVAGYGGGIVLVESDALLLNTFLADNQAIADSSALYSQGSAPRLVHTTFARNHGGDGTGVTISSGALAFTNTILVGHSVGIHLMSGSSAALQGTLWGSGLWANGTDWTGPGVIDTGSLNLWASPRFASPQEGDYHIRFGSAAMDAGLDASTDTDFDGEPRPAFGGFDLGADEYYEEAIAGLATSSDSPTMIGGSTTLTATLAAGTRVTYTWALGDGSSASGQIVAHTYPAVGLYVAVVTASNHVNQLAAATTIEITERPHFPLYLPLILQLQPPAGTPTPTATHTPTPTPTPTHTPSPTPTPTPSPVQVYSFDGSPWTWPEMQAYFGPVDFARGTADGPLLVTLRAARGYAAIRVCVQNPDGSPAPGVIVLRHWPGAPLLPPELQGEWYNTAVWGVTEGNGCIGFAMGGGDYYWPPQCGPSDVWVRGGDVVHCLGMVGGTDHHHLDLDYRLSGALNPTCPPRWRGVAGMDCTYVDLMRALGMLGGFRPAHLGPGYRP